MNTALTTQELSLLPDYRQIAFYLRLSMADGDLGRGDKDESNSIENQRLLLREYVGRIIRNRVHDEYGKVYMEEFVNAYLESVIEYIDDGYSGTNFDRPAFKRMIEDAKKKQINTIIVKDTSRLGRDYIETGDYMEQIFPLLEIRFIAVNNGYDSDNYRNTTRGLETSIINLVNAEYSKDLSHKVKSAKQTLWKQGIPTCAKPPFGYIVVNKKYEIDPETASVVRLIFDKAIVGWNTSRIVNFLNEQGVPTPGIFIQRRTGKPVSNRVVSDDEWLWDIWKVHRVLKNYAYTGSMVHGKYSTLSIGSNNKRHTDKKDWYILENTHDAIVSVEEWKKAQGIINSRTKSTVRFSTDYVLLGKIRCGVCGLAMEYHDAANSVVYCSHALLAGKASKCCRTRHDAKRIESLVACKLRQQIQLLKFFELKIREQKNEGREFPDIAVLKKQTETNIETLKTKKVRQYEAYADGKLGREEYILKKNEISEKLAQLEESLRRAEAVEAEENELLGEIQVVTSEAEKLNERKGPDKLLTREMVLAMIDTVTIYDGQTIEVKFTFDDIGRRAMEYVERHTV